MRIDELSLTNFKCFENEPFHFHPHFNVIIGNNGSGKTSLLDALAIAMQSYLSIFIGRPFIHINEVRTITIDGQPKPQLPAEINFNITIHDNIISNSFIQLFRIINNGREEHSFHKIDEIEQAAKLDFVEKKKQGHTYETSKIEDIADNDLSNSRSIGNTVKFPMIAYYGTGRLSKNIGEIAYFKQGEGVSSAYKDCLKAHLSDNIFLSWYKTMEDTVNKFKQPLHVLQLKLFKETITSIIPEWTDMSFNYLEDDMMGILKNDDGTTNMLPFKNLSDGYRNVIGIVADMVYRCIQLNPGLKEDAVKETEGVVLIDEIDLHLHPEWQKNIVGDLKRVFPKVQFIVTTHSPFIIQSLSKDELIILDEDVTAEKDPWRQSIEEIAENEMQVEHVRRSELFKMREEKAKEYFTLVKQNDTQDTLRPKIEVAKRELDKLAIEFSDDPAYVAMLRTQLEKAEHNAAHI